MNNKINSRQNIYTNGNSKNKKETEIMNKLESAFDTAIEERLENKSWDIKIANQVYKKKKAKKLKQKVVLVSLSAALATASLLLIFNPFAKSQTAETLDKWISQQIDGTYNSVFIKENSKENAMLSITDEDKIIADALNMR